MANFKNGIHLSVKLDTKNQVEGELNKLISQLNKNKIELNINTSNLRKNLQDAFNLDGITKSAYASAKVFENELNSIGDKLGKIREKSERKNRENNALQEAKDINKALEEQYKLEQQMSTIRAKADYNSKQREIQEQNQLNKTLEDEKKIIDEIENKRVKSENKSKLENQKQELAQAQAINKALEDNYKTGLKEVEIQRKLEQQMESIRAKADANSSKRYRNEELSQAKAINKALEDNYKSTLKEAEAQKQVQQEIQKQIKLLEIKKQGMLSEDSKTDTSDIDKAISKYKELDNISMKDLRNEISYINAELKESSSNAEGFIGKITSSLRGIGVYIDIGDVFRGFVNSAKDAIKYVMDVENSMIDLRRVVEMSDSQAQSFQNSMHNLSVEMASTNSDTISTVATFSKLGYSLQEATQLGEITTKYNFAADINNIEDATLSLVSTMKSYKIEASDAIGITNDINEVSNNYAVSANDINTILQKSASTMSTFGNSLKQNIALGTVANEVMQNSDTVGQALKSIGARLTTNSNALDELEAMNISIEDANGNLKSTYQIFKEMSPLIQNMKGEELARVSNNLFGKQQISTGLSIVQNYQQLDKVMGTLENTTSSVSKEFDRYLDSTQAKLSQLKENLGGLGSQFVNSNMTKGTVDGLNLLVTSITTVISKLGSIPTVIATVVGSLTIFNSKFRESMTAYQPAKLTDYANKLKSLSTLYKTDVGVINQKIIAQKNEISTENQVGVSYISSRAKLVGYQTQLGVATIKQNLCAISAKALGVAFNMALGAGIGIAIQLISDWANHADIAKQKNEELLASMQQTKTDINSLDELRSKYESLNSELQNGNLTNEETIQKKSELKDVYNQLIQACPQLEGALSLENGRYEDNIELIKQAIKLKEEQLKLDTEKYLTDNDVNDKGIQKQINKIKELQEAIENFSQKSLRTDDELINGGDMTVIGKMFGGGDDRRKYFEQLKNDSKQELIDLQNELQTELSKINSAEALGINIGVSEESKDGINQAVATISQILNDESKSLDDNTSSIKLNSNGIQLLKQAQEELNSIGVVSQDTLNKLNQECPELEINAKNASEVLGGMSDSLDGVGDSANDTSESFNKLSNEFNSIVSQGELVDKVLKEMSEQDGLSLDTWGQVIKDPEILQALSDQSIAVEELNKLREKDTQTIQTTIDKAIESANIELDNTNLVTDEKLNSDNAKLASDENTQNAIQNKSSETTDNNANNYELDDENFANLGSSKTTTSDAINIAIGEGNANLVNGLAETYGTDTVNFANAQNSKIQSLNQFLSAMNQASAQVISENTVGTGTKIIADAFDVKSVNKIAGGGYNKVGASNPYNKVGSSTGGGSSGSGSSSKGGSGSSGQSDAEKWTDKIKDLNSSIDIDRYADLNSQLDILDNHFTENKNSLDGLTEGTKAYHDKQKEQIDIMKEQASVYNLLAGSYATERDELKQKLSQYDILTDTTGKLTNAEAKLQYQQDLANDMSGNTEAEYNAKKKQIDDVKELEENIKRYREVTESEIPKCTQKWDELNNTIIKTQREQLQTMMDDLASALETKYSKAKEEELKSVEDWYSQRKENLESEYQQDLESLQDEKQSIVDEYDEQIKKLQAQLDKLNDTTDDKNARLASLKAELSLWQKDDSVFSSRKKDELNKAIKDLELEIQKDNLQKELDALKEKQSAQEDSLSTEIDNLESAHDDELDELEKSYDERKQETEDHYDKLLDEQSRYNEASKLMMNNSQDEILGLLSSKSEDWKNVGSLLGENFAEGLRSKVEQTMSDLSSLTGGMLGNNNSTSRDDSYSSKESNMATSSGNSNSKSDSINGKSYTVDSSGNISSKDALSNEEIAEIQKKIARFATGGRTPSNMSGGKLGILDPNEKILNSEDTNTFDKAMTIVNTDLKNFIDKFNDSHNNTLNGYNNLDVFGNTTDLNSIANRAMNNTTNNNSNENSTVVNMYNTITNNNLQDVGLGTKEIEKVVRKVVKDDGRRYK